MFDFGGSSTFSQGRTTNSYNDYTDNWTNEQKQASRKLGDYFNTSGIQKKLVSKDPITGEEKYEWTGSPQYTGKRVAGMSGNEQAAQGWLGNYINQKAPDQYGWANSAAKRSASGDYKDIVDDKATDALYHSIKAQTLKELPELQNTLANNANLSGMYFSGGHEKLQGDLLSDTQTSLLNKLAEMKYGDEQQRRDIALDREQRQLSGAQLAAQLGELQEGGALRKAEAGMTYGSVPRQIEQQQADADYEEFLRTLPENSSSIEQMMAYLKLQGQQSKSGSSTTNSFNQSHSITGNFGF